MLSTPENCPEELCELKERYNKLAQEKSYLQLVVTLINRIISVSGLDNIADNILHGLLNIIGGTNLILYYRVDDTLWCTDIAGIRQQLDRCDDEAVAAAFATGQPSEIELDFSETQMMTSEFGKAFTWVYPLTIGHDVAGVLRIENLHITMQEMNRHLLTLFSYIAMTLRNEITSESRLKKAYDELTLETAARRKAQEELQVLNDLLEQRVADRTEALIIANEAIDSERAYIRSLLEASLDPLVTINEEGKITDVNEASVAATGISREQMIGTDFSNYFTDPARARKGYLKVFAEGVVQDYPLSIRHLSGRVVDVLYNATVYRDSENNVQGVFAAARDVTALKKAEQSIKQLNEELELRVIERTAELERINRELEEFCYAISHEFRAPVARFEGFGSMLLDMGEELDTESVHHCAERIVAASRRLRTVIDSLLTLSRLSRAGMHIQKINLSDMVKHILTELVEAVDDRTVTISIMPGVTAAGDLYMLETCLRNLLGNALKYTAHNPETEIGFGETTVDGETVYFVRDNGVGFDMEFTKNIFVPFCKLHSESEFQGTGIGLSTVHRIIEKHQGRIWAESEEGKGTTFYFTLGMRK